MGSCGCDERKPGRLGQGLDAVPFEGCERPNKLTLQYAKRKTIEAPPCGALVVPVHPNNSFRLVARPARAPQVTDDDITIRQKNGGLYLPCGGEWVLGLSAVGSASAGSGLNIVVYDSRDPYVAKWMERKALMLTSDQSITVGVASVELLDANPYREYLFVQNNTGNNIYVRAFLAATLASGWLLAGKGANREFDGETQKVPRGKIFAIADVAAQSVIVMEGE